MTSSECPGIVLAVLGDSSIEGRRVPSCRPAFAALVCVLALGILVARAWAAAGSLDPSFGDGGRVVVDFSPNFDRANAVAAQPDGKVVLAGTDDLSSDRAQFALVRLNPDGSLDRSFGKGGMRTVGFGHKHDDEASSVAVDGDGRIVVAGDSDNRGVIARLNPDGSLDRSFSGDGRAEVGTNLDISGIALQRDGRIVITATKWSLANKLAVARLRTNGALDKSFADGGLRTVGFPGRHNYGETDDIAGGVAIQSDGKIVLAGGSFREGVGEQMAVARLRPRGRLDNSFGTAGTVTSGFGYRREAIASSVAIEPSGKIVAAGTVAPRPGCRFAALRLRSDGRLDDHFSRDGRQAVGFGGHGGIDDCGAYGLAIQPNSRIVMAGESPSLPGRSNQLAVARLLRSGEPDPSFSGDGRMAIGFGNGARRDWANGVALEPDGKIVAAGMTWQPEGQDFAVARFRGA